MVVVIDPYAVLLGIEATNATLTRNFSQYGCSEKMYRTSNANNFFNFRRRIMKQASIKRAIPEVLLCLFKKLLKHSSYGTQLQSHLPAFSGRAPGGFMIGIVSSP